MLLRDKSVALIQQEFAAIRELVNEAIAAAILRRREYPDFLDGERINWQTLKCELVGYGFNELEQEYYLAFVKNAHPTATGLNDFIHNWVKIHGYDVLIKLEG